MTKIVQQTLFDLRETNYLLTRFNPGVAEPDDLDVLIRPNDFKKSIELLKTKGYQCSSHDQALGGRIAGMQINLTKPKRIKIDLHQDFTWRKKRYMNIEKIWLNSRQNRIDSTWDAFLIMVNVIFEKTYFMPTDFELFINHWGDIKKSQEFTEQTIQYNWNATFINFVKWIENQQLKPKFPLFLPVKLILYSYQEKSDFVSLAYYVFFRIRYLVNQTLPYEKQL